MNTTEPRPAVAGTIRPSRTLVTVQQLAASQPGIGEGAIRWDLFNRRTNGLEASGAIVRRGRKVLLDLDRYLDWLAGSGSGAV